MPFPWVVWVFDGYWVSNLSFHATKGDEISIPSVQSISKNRNQSDDFCDWAGICSSSYRLSGCSDWWWLLIFQKKEWLEKNTGGEDFLKEAGLTCFNIIFIKLHWVTLQKRRVWIFQGKLLCFSREHFYHWWTVYCYQQIARRHRNSNHFDELAPQSCFPRVLYWV